MKNFKIMLAGLCCYAASNQVYAQPYFYKEPYLGLEAIQTNQHFKARYGKKVFKNNLLNYEAFAGFKFHREFGLEFGYELQPKQSKNVLLVAGDAMPGMSLLTAGNTLYSSSRITSNHKNIGLFAEFKETFFKVKFRFQLLIGASLSTVQAKTTANGVVRTYEKSKLLPRVKFSVIYPIKDNLGIKLSANYRHMGAFDLRSLESIGSSRIKLKDAFGVGLGLVYIFTYT